jgi:hypothetical protein
MRTFFFALALLCTLQAHGGEGWRTDLAKVIDAEHAIVEQVMIHPNRRIVLCLLFPSQHYVAYKARLSADGEHVLSYIHLKYDFTKKYFPWIKWHKKAYLEPLKGYKFKIPKEKKTVEVKEIPEVLDDSSPCVDNVDGQPEPDIDE